MATVSEQNQSSGVSVTPLIVFGVLSLVFGFIMWWAFPYLGVVPVRASQEAENTDALFQVLIGIGGVVFFLVQGLIYYAAIAFRARDNDTSDGPSLHGDLTLEIIWTIVPSVIVVFLAVYAFLVWQDNTAVSETPNIANGESIVINAFGQRYAWSFEYISNERESVVNPDGTVAEDAGDRVIFTTNDLYLYAEQNVHLQMETRDVIHSFWSPEMRIKQDLLPGRVTEVRFTPNDPGLGWESVMVVSPVTLYASADFASEVVYEVLSTETDFGTVPVSVELGLVNPNFVVEEGSALAWAEVTTADGLTAYLPISPETVWSRFNRYRLICTELCGGGHGDMFTDLVVFEDADGFETTWYNPMLALNSLPAGNPIDYGDRVIDAYGCAGCHALSERGWAGAVGPALNGIGARAGETNDEATAASGNDVITGAEYIAQSLRHPQAYFATGYSAIMPAFDPATMPQEDLVGIVAYLCTQTGGDAASSTCGLENWEFDADGNFTADTGALVEELTVISNEYED